MAISLSGFKQEGQRRATSERLAKEYAAQQKREKSRSGWAKLMGSTGGKLLGGALGGFLGIASGGLLMPLIAGASTYAAKKMAHDVTAGWGARTGALKAGEYGYGKAEAKTLREGLEEQARFKGDIGKDILGSYIAAGVGGKLGGVKGALKKGGGGWEQALGRGELYGTKGGWAGMKEGLGGLFGEDTEVTEAKLPTIVEKEELSEAAKEFDPLALTTGASTEPLLPREDLSELLSGTGQVGGALAGLPAQSPILQGQVAEGFTFPAETFGARDIGQSYETDIGQSYETNFMGGGMVSNKAPTISEYFNMQGKTLGGSNNKSLAQILGIKQHG